MQFILQLLLRRQEFVNGRIQQADDYRIRCHRLEQIHAEIRSLHGQQFIQSLLPLLLALCDDHIDHNRQPVNGIEHAFGAAQTYSFGAVADGPARIQSSIRIGQNLELRHLVSPAEQGVQLVRKLRLDPGHRTRIDVATGAVDGYQVAFFDDDIADVSFTSSDVNRNNSAPATQGLPMPLCNHGRMGGLATATGQNPSEAKSRECPRAWSPRAAG